MIHSSIANVKPTLVDGKFITNDFIGLTKYFILQELLKVNQTYSNKFGDIVICIDKPQGGYWRRDIYPGYKACRKKKREESQIIFSEVFKEIDALIDQIHLNLPWKVVTVSKAEADDIMLVLAKEYSPSEKILIYSPDKDMIQAQRSGNVFQYSSLIMDWLKPENKHSNMDHWLLEHICLGDSADEVPKIVDHTEFSDVFVDYLCKHGFKKGTTPIEFKESTLSQDEKIKLIEDFDVYKTNRKGENTDVKNIYKDMRFGPTTLSKAIEKFGSLDNWLDSHPLYRKHYNRNHTLVMEEGIPDYIRESILEQYKEASISYNPLAFEEYLKGNNLTSIIIDFSTIFRINRDLTADDFGW
jgi:5'-3' exonuclease